MSIANGHPWLGFPTRQGKVLLIDNELHDETLASRVKTVADAMPGLSLNSLDGWIECLPLRGKLLDLEQMADFFKTVPEGEYAAIVLDAFYRFMPTDRDENSNGDMASLYNLIDQYSKATKASFIMVHHASKGNQSGKSVTDMGAGAGAQSRAADTHLVIRPHEEEGVSILEARVRSFPPVKPMCLTWDKERRVFELNLEADPTKHEGLADQPRGSKRTTYRVEDLLGCIGMGEVGRRKVIEDAIALGMSKTRANDLFSGALEDGLIEEVRTKLRGSAVTVYRLTKAEPTSTKEAVEWATDDE
jgi:hypothetical protein